MKYIHKRIPLGDTCVLPQVRKTFEEEALWELANDIASNGILQPTIVTALTEDEMRTHLALESKINKIPLSIENYHPSSDGLYYRLVAGERRYRAHKLLLTHGCEICREEGRSGAECYALHFGGGEPLIEVRVCMHLSAREAKSMQFRENIHRRPPPHEEAQGFMETYRTFKEEDRSYTLAEFSRYAGVGTQKIREALVYVELPASVKDPVEKGLFHYGHALKFKKLLDALKDEGGEQNPLFQNLLTQLMALPGIKVDDFGKSVDRAIGEIGQYALFGELKPYTQREIRRVVGKEFIPLFIQLDGYLRRLEYLIEQGKVGKGHEFSGISPNGQIRRTFQRLRQLTGIALNEEQQKQLDKIDFEKPLKKPQGNGPRE